MELFKSHTSMQSNQDTLSTCIENVGTPVQDEAPASSSSVIITPWTALQPGPSETSTSVTLEGRVSTLTASVPQSHSLYTDIQDYVEKEVFSPITDDEALPNPEPLVKKRKTACAAKSSESLTDRLSQLEDNMNKKFKKVEEAVQRIEGQLLLAIQENSSQQQHYVRSLVAVLHKDVKSVKDSVQKFGSLKSQLPSEVIKSIVDLNGSLLQHMRKTE